ncbi:motility associated factor glycosyltransferase family protein [Spirochaeta cellobiosiphila]|uniref:motility associated factor glycosyltransferase family protein n=1 Tax=Spirochaeta cellobiosiphila TaxID=504483 RepID=UPI00041EA63D|nr:6-hydroxymethylpterin diphosphokinase MptE-like protein [Spirochaeta cellobiosiphila]
MSDSLYERNLLSLSIQSSLLAEKLSACTDQIPLKFITSQTGELVPLRPDNNKPYHSRFDPVKEVTRWIDHSDIKDYVLVVGIGGGFHIKKLLEKPNVSRVFIVEKDITLVKSLLQKIDLSSILSDPRVCVCCDDSIERIKNYLLSDYLPSLYGNLNFLPLRNYIDNEPDFISGIKFAIQETVNVIADDYTVQSYFGKQWYRNTILNLPLASQIHGLLSPIKHAVIAGAGPSLEEQLKFIRKEQTVIATDTALPVFLNHGIRPDFVISMDCQSFSYLHFLQGLPKDIPLILDLASPPVLSRLTQKPIFFSSGHPLSQYIGNNLRTFPSLNTKGGNISHTAISLAHALGAQDISLLGIDLSYPWGKPYARGTYVYPYFQTKESRYSPILDQTLKLVFKNKNIMIEKTSSGYRYTTKPMINYKTRMEEYLNELPMQIKLPPTKGVTLNIKKNKTPPRTDSRLFGPGPLKQDLSTFLEDYSRDLRSHPLLNKDKHFYEFSMKEKDILMTVLPTVSAFGRINPDNTTKENAESAFHWCLEQVENQINQITQNH